METYLLSFSRIVQINFGVLRIAQSKNGFIFVIALTSLKRLN